ncbi:hypothetical protein PS051_25210 (plasmid) [Escherichia albertii]|uniref:hypothetical protein n=1 Tax=Escherichia albertii TaxID=208962 RepID=UPI00235DE73A|nr:hypothetical protein [Escherichia albertii]MCZ8880679.1 hypothetical protein [Escherichia albertii]WDB90911.1 hypothetical protein PS051_25210 [Escherichia albertii]
MSRSLQQAVQRRLPEEILAPYRECVSFFLERAVQALRIHPAGESDCPAARRAYYRREQMVLRLGFTSLMKLKVFMAGFVG